MEVSVSFLKEGNYKKYIESINKTEADYIHFDVMDGKFVNNKNLPLKELLELIYFSEKKNDVHLMVKNPSKYIEKLALYDIEYLTIHSEIDNCDMFIDKIRSFGIKPGIAINPYTDVEKVLPLLSKVNLVLVMGVVPGESGQTFILETEKKIKRLKEEIVKRGLSVKISVDGGICEEVLDKVRDADIVVSASYVLNDLSNIAKIKKFYIE